jgi:hypothetical protein
MYDDVTGTGAHGCPARGCSGHAGAVHNWARGGPGWSLRARGSQTKLSHVDAVAGNARKRACESPSKGRRVHASHMHL